MITSILNRIKKFYHSSFWRMRYYRRIEEEKLNISYYKQAIKCTDKLIDEITFKSYKDDTSSNGLSYGKVIELNLNIDTWERDIEHYENLIMHEFGHIQYNQKEFRQTRELNRVLFKNIPQLRGLKKRFPLFNPPPSKLKSDSDIKYFSDSNEIRQRIIPLIKMMYDNNWSPKETYNKTCKYDDIFDLYSKDLIIFWINNML